MVNRSSARLALAAVLSTFLCSALIAAEVTPTAKTKEKTIKVKLLSSNQDLIDNTYIDRGRLQGVKVGDRYKIYSAAGTQVTEVIVTSIYDRMSAVKIVDSQLLKDGMTARSNGRKSYQAFSGLGSRRPAPEITISKAKTKKAAANAASPTAEAAVPAPEAPSAEAGVPAPAAPTADAGVPAPAAPTADAGVPAPPAPTADAGVPAPAAPTADAGVPAPPAPTADAGVPAPAAPTADAGVPAPPAPTADAGVPAPPAAPTADAGVPAPAAPSLPSDDAGPAVPPPPAP